MTLNEYLEGEFPKVVNQMKWELVPDTPRKIMAQDKDVREWTDKMLASIRNFYITKLEEEVKELEEMKGEKHLCESGEGFECELEKALSTIIARKQVELKEITSKE